MNLSVHRILVVLALLCFVLAALAVTAPLALGWLGLAFLAGSMLT